MRLENTRLVEVEMSMEVPYAFSPWFSSRAYTTILLLPVSTTDTEPNDTSWWLQSDQAARSLELQNCLKVKHRNYYLSFSILDNDILYVLVYEDQVNSLNIHEISLTVEDEVGNTGILLLAAIPEGKLQQDSTSIQSQRSQSWRWRKLLQFILRVTWMSEPNCIIIHPIVVKITKKHNINLMLALEEKRDDHQRWRDSSSGYHEYTYQI